MPLPSLAVGHETTLSVERRSQRRRVGVSLLEPLQQRRRLARHRPDHLWPTRARMGVARQMRQQARHCGRLGAAVREALRGASLVRARQAAGQPPVRQLEGELHHAYSRHISPTLGGLCAPARESGHDPTVQRDAAPLGPAGRDGAHRGGVEVEGRRLKMGCATGAQLERRRRGGAQVEPPPPRPQRRLAPPQP